MRKSTDPAPRRRTLPRQSAAETAEVLLAAGERIVRRYLHEGPSRGEKPIDILAFVGIDDVLAEATEHLRQAAVARGSLTARARVSTLTPGAFYRAFPAPGGKRGPRRKGEALAIFRRELGRRLVSAQAYRDDVTLLTDALLPIDGIPNDAQTRLISRKAATIEIERWHDSPTDLLFYGLIPYAKDPEVGKWLREVNDRALDYLEEFWREWLPRLGRRCRAGITERHLACAIRGFLAVMNLEDRIEGSPSRDRVTVTDREPALAGTWHMPAIVVEGIFLTLTEPVAEQ